MTQVYTTLFTAALLILGVLMIACLALKVLKDSQPGSGSSYSESKATFLAVGSSYKWATISRLSKHF